MAKKSSIEKNNRRKRLVVKFAAKRAALKAMANDQSLPQVGALRGPAQARRAAPQLGPGAGAQPLRPDRPAARLLPQVQPVANCAARAGVGRVRPRRREVELVTETAPCP